jgi:hypothetical protein
MAFEIKVSDIFQEDLCAFNTSLQSLPSALSLPGTLEGSKYHNSAETWQKHELSPKRRFDEPLVHYGKII